MAQRWNQLKSCSLTCLVFDVGCQLGPQRSYRLEHLLMASLHLLGLPNSMAAGVQRVSFKEAVSPLMTQPQKSRRVTQALVTSLPRSQLSLGGIFFFFNLFLTVLDLRCCTRAFSSCGERGLLFVVVHGLLIAVASLVAEHRLQAHRLQQLWLAGSRAQAQQLWHTGLVVPWHAGSSRTRARTRVPCIGRRILNHCTTREAWEVC